jgi:lipopolysaccharide/colanic/teichoic acid biosynthesis glycosyltransferase
MHHLLTAFIHTDAAKEAAAFTRNKALHIPENVNEFISVYTGKDADALKIIQSNSRLAVEALFNQGIKVFANLQKVNDIRYLNKYFEHVNMLLPFYGVFIGCVETKGQRAERIFRKFPKPVAYPYYVLDFILKRMMPKFRITRKIYFLITKGRNRVLSKAETLGRLVSCGFSILEIKEMNNLLYFAVSKARKPYFDMHPSYGPLFKMRRIGKDGRMIGVYKLRTMHPYAEYLQAYVHQVSSLKEGGKFNNDFRITDWGRVFRKLWLDEVPMILNLLKGDLKLVGVRPLSQHYLSLYTEELRNKRLKYKPGLVPPYYADMPKTLEEIMASEMRYLEAYEKNPLLTDWQYFWKAFYNIVIKRARSG